MTNKRYSKNNQNCNFIDLCLLIYACDLRFVALCISIYKFVVLCSRGTVLDNIYAFIGIEVVIICTYQELEL